jgi:hypothetical protein
MPAEAKGAPRRAKVAGRLYPTDAHGVNFLLRNPKSNVEKCPRHKSASRSSDVARASCPDLSGSRPLWRGHPARPTSLSCCARHQK